MTISQRLRLEQLPKNVQGKFLRKLKERQSQGKKKTLSDKK